MRVMKMKMKTRKTERLMMVVARCLHLSSCSEHILYNAIPTAVPLPCAMQ